MIQISKHTGLEMMAMMAFGEWLQTRPGKNALVPGKWHPTGYDREFIIVTFALHSNGLGQGLDDVGIGVEQIITCHSYARFKTACEPMRLSARPVHNHMNTHLACVEHQRG
jgi:hypothetical protein